MVGKTVLHYKIIEKLGEGGMGVVYKAEDTKLDRTVAIKFLPRHIAADSEERKRFVVEAKAAAALSHPNIATVHSIEEAEDSLFIVMEYIDGRELREEARTGELDIEKIVGIAIQIAEGLQTAHDKGIIHRDIKSSNIMMTDKGRVKIMDFGLAKFTASSGETALLTKLGTTLGTTAYMSPEQVRGEELDERTDIWSLGVVFYELLTGTMPFSGPYEQAVMYSIMNEDPVRISDLRGDVSPALEGIVAKCLQKDPLNRYQAVSEVLFDLQHLGEQESSGSLVAREGKKTTRPGFKRILQPGTVAIAVVSIALVLLLMLLPAQLSVIKSWVGLDSVPGKQHLLVLPLTNVGGDSTNQALCNGLMETLTSKLTQLEQLHGSLWVVPASEVIRNNINSPSEAHKLFGVNMVLTGSLQVLDKKFRLILNLVDATNLRQLNSSVIDIEESDAARLQDRSVITLLQMLNLELNPVSQGLIEAGNTSVPEAYEYYLQGRGYLHAHTGEGNVESAIRAFRLAVQEDSLYALAHAGLGMAYWEQYDLLNEPKWVDEAIRECMLAYNLDNKLAYVNIALGTIHSGLGRYSEAVQDFNRALDSEPTNAAAYRGLANAFDAQGMVDEAESTYLRAIEMKPDYWGGYSSLGGFYYKHSRYEEAIAQFRQVIKLAPENHIGYNSLGAMYYFLKRWSDARKMFERSLAIKKTYGAASNLGTLYYNQGRYADAARTYETALELNSRSYVLWGNLGSAYYYAPGERSKAQGAYQEAIKLAEVREGVNPKDASVLSQLAGYYAMISNRSKAVTFLDRALELAPKDAEVMFRAGTTYEQLGERELAITWIAKAIENGYSKADIEHQPELRELLADQRFQQLMQD